VTRGQFTEDQLVEQPAASLFAELGWRTLNAYEEHLGPDGTLGRDNQGEVVLLRELRPALERLNPGLLAEALNQAVVELTKDRSVMDAIRANREFYDLIREGVKVKVRNPEDGSISPETVRVIDWDDPQNNDYLLVSQFWVVGDFYKRRADLVGFVNGLPLVLIELKASHKRLKDAYEKNLTDYRATIPRIFWANAFIILSNGSASSSGPLPRSGSTSPSGRRSTARANKASSRWRPCSGAPANQPACWTSPRTSRPSRSAPWDS